MSVSINTRAIASAAEHRDIFQALCAGNAELAEQLAVRHVEMARENILTTAQADSE
jgi:DNA-binding GntR family transcriptional regulator